MCMLCNCKKVSSPPNELKQMLEGHVINECLSTISVSQHVEAFKTYA